MEKFLVFSITQIRKSTGQRDWEKALPLGGSSSPIHPEAENQHMGQRGERGPVSHLSVGAGIKEEYPILVGAGGYGHAYLICSKSQETVSHLLFKTVGSGLLLQ